jgi:predicted MFS family arabinose efflux permease
MSVTHKPLSTLQVLACGATIVTLSMGIRHAFGLAIQNLVWGISGIFAGMVADRFGAFRVVIVGSVLYALGLVGMANASTPLLFSLSAGVLIGMAQAGTTYAVIYGVIGRNVSADKRSWAMGVAAAAGSFGQFLMVPTEGFLISQFGWQQALMLLGMASLLMIPLSWGLREPGFGGGAVPYRDQSIVQALREAFKYPSFQLLMAGYFVCGFQVVFIGVHMPSYLKDKGLSPQVASYALALIGLFNVFGTYAAGVLGQKMPKKNILAFIYFTRAIAISLFLLVPLSPASVYVFSAVMGLLWLSTVPPTNATVAQIFGVAHLSMLGGFVFFSHQIGSFMGVWLGGYLYDKTGSYDIVWYIAIALGVAAALINLPVKEAAISRALPPEAVTP